MRSAWHPSHPPWANHPERPSKKLGFLDRSCGALVAELPEASFDDLKSFFVKAFMAAAAPAAHHSAG